MVNGNGNGNGSKDYNPSKEYEHLDDNFWVEEDIELEERRIAYTDEILQEIDGEDTETDTETDNN